MKNYLLAAILCLSFAYTGCKKESTSAQDQPKSLIGKKFESYWFTASGGEKYYYRLKFKSSDKVDYLITYINETFVTGQGVSELSYSIDDPLKEFPNIRITGTLNNAAGQANKGDKVDYTLVYTPALGNAKASLATSGKYYMEY